MKMPDDGRLSEEEDCVYERDDGETSGITRNDEESDERKKLIN